MKRYSCIDFERLESKYEIMSYVQKANYEWRHRKLKEKVIIVE